MPVEVATRPNKELEKNGLASSFRLYHLLGFARLSFAMAFWTILVALAALASPATSQEFPDCKNGPVGDTPVPSNAWIKDIGFC